jgi:hypothetical protein
MSVCKKCGSSVDWQTIDGQLRCLNADGSDHWDLCRDITNAKFIEGATWFVHKNREGWRKNGQELVMLERAYTHTTRTICPAPCGIPPWEVCTTCPIG